jgi:hypothetical protein
VVAGLAERRRDNSLVHSAAGPLLSLGIVLPPRSKSVARNIPPDALSKTKTKPASYNGAIWGSRYDAMQLPRGDHVVGAHHFIVLMLEDVAMPDVASDKTFEANDDSRDHSWIRSNRVFPSSFVRIGRYRRPRVLQDALVFIEEGFEAAPVEDLESNQMKMDGVGIVGQVNQVPDFN